MIAHICNKCGCTLTYASDCKISIYTHPYGNIDYELCEKCKNDFLKWIESDPFQKFRKGEKI